jgi:UDP-2,3-diacylglucosamine pyrophosphatase LpxH
MTTVILSDLHIGSRQTIVTSSLPMDRIAGALDDRDVTRVILAGDTFDCFDTPLRECLDRAGPFFQMLAASHHRPTLEIMPGNHDLILKYPAGDAQVLRGFLRRFGVRLLRPDIVDIGDRVAVTHGHLYEAWLYDLRPDEDWRRWYEDLCVRRALARAAEDRASLAKIREALQQGKDREMSPENILLGMDAVAKEFRIRRGRSGRVSHLIFGHTHLHNGPTLFEDRLYTNSGCWVWDQYFVDKFGPHLALPGTIVRVDRGGNVQVVNLLADFTAREIHGLRQG